MATLNDRNILSLRLDLPATGAWHAEVEVDYDEDITGEVSIVVDETTWTGTVVRGGNDFKRWRGMVVGGKGGLSTVVVAKYYSSGIALDTPLTDLLTATGESLSSTVSQELRDHVVARWQRMKGPASRALVALFNEVGANWRLLADGTLWFGEETWPAAELPAPILMDEDWSAGRLVFSDALALEPGQTYEDNRIYRVVHYIEDSRLTTEAWTRGSMLDRILEVVRRQTDYHALWPATVVKHIWGSTLELLPDDERLRGIGGLDKVPLRVDSPGSSILVAAGARVYVGFDGGDPKRPYATLFDFDPAKLISQTVTAQNMVGLLAPLAILGGNSDFVALAAKVDAQLAALDAVFSAWTPVAFDGGLALKTLLTALQIGPPTWPASVAATKAKAE